MDRTQATLAEKTYFGDIDNAVAYLQECKNKGQNVYIDFNGHKLYSCDVTIDSAYMEIRGMTKEEDESFENRMRNAKTKEEKALIIQEWNELSKSRKKEHENKKEGIAGLESLVKSDEEIDLAVMDDKTRQEEVPERE